jgi:hypothetical protein
VPPCEDDDRDDEDPEFFPPRLDAPGEFAILAARSFDIPLSFNASYCFSFLTFALFEGISTPFVGVNASLRDYPSRRRENAAG